MPAKPKTVDECLARVNDVQRAALEKLGIHGGEPEGAEPAARAPRPAVASSGDRA